MSNKEEFKKCKDDKARWEWLIANKPNDLTVLLDNDDTFVTAKDDEDYCVPFNEYIGNSYGVQVLLKALGIPHDGV